MTVSLITSAPLTPEVLEYLRIQRATSSELDHITTKKTLSHVSDHNEDEVLHAFKEGLEGLLTKFSMSAEGLEIVLKCNIYEPGGRKWAAVIVSLGEQLIVCQALQEVDKRLRPNVKSEQNLYC